jgi:hypothetical protein
MVYSIMQEALKRPNANLALIKTTQAVLVSLPRHALGKEKLAK